MKSMKIILAGKTLLDLHTIEPSDYVIASFYVENNGDASSRYWVKLYLDGNLYRQYQSTALAPGERSSAYNIHVYTDTKGSHTVLVEVNPFDTPVTDSVADTFMVAEIPKITKHDFYNVLIAKGAINTSIIPEGYGSATGNQDKWFKHPMADYIGWWSSKLYKHNKVLIAIVVTGDCGNPPQNLDCVYFTDWGINYSWDELPEEIATEALDKLPVTGGGPGRVSITFITKEDGSGLSGIKLYIDGNLIGETMPSLTVELEPGKTVHVKLVKEGYRTLEFDYTVPNTAATVTKTLVAKKADFKIEGISPAEITDAHPGDSIYLRVTVKNVGDKADTGLIQIAWDGSVMRAFGLASIDPGQTRVISPPSFSIPGGASIGTHKITVFVNPSSEENPTDSRDIPVVLKPPTVEVTFTTKDEQGNEIRGVDVYIDGVKKGTT